MRASLAQLHRRLGTTTVYVTHDQVEAMTLGQRVAVMRDGRIVQADQPQRLYQEPNDLFVAAFIGSPAMNLVPSQLDGDAIAFGQFRVPLEAAPAAARPILGIRPESFEDAAFAPPGLPSIEVEVEVVEELGSDTFVFFQVDAPPINAEILEAGDDGLLASDRALFTARVDSRSRARVGQRLELALDPARFQFFAADTGARLRTASQTPAMVTR
jgi:multiple sugar transport system ATP-binding protein